MTRFRLDHVGVVVTDIAEATRFFRELGFRCGEPAEVGGPWVDRVIGVVGARSIVASVSAPDSDSWLELTEFQHPVATGAPEALPANALGYRHVAFEVPDIVEIVERTRAAGYALVGEVVDYEDVYRLAYIRGPEGMIVEVAQDLRAT